MENKELRIRVQKANWFFGTELIFYECGYDKAVVNIGKLLMEPFKPRGQAIPDESRIIMDDKTSQILMDDLWSCGVRPTEGQGSAGAMAATTKHLGDMRTLVQKCMKVELPSKFV